MNKLKFINIHLHIIQFLNQFVFNIFNYGRRKNHLTIQKILVLQKARAWIKNEKYGCILWNIIECKMKTFFIPLSSVNIKFVLIKIVMMNKLNVFIIITNKILIFNLSVCPTQKPYCQTYTTHGTKTIDLWYC